MDFVRNFPLFSIVLSLFSGVLCTMLDGKKAERYTTVYELFLIALNGAVLRYVLQTGESFTYVMGEFPAPWGNEIRAGVMEALLGLFSSWSCSVPCWPDGASCGRTWMRARSICITRC